MTRKVLPNCLLLLSLVNLQSCTEKPRVETENVAATARKTLDAPFHFLLRVPDYEAKQFTHESDMFSTWGELALAKKSGVQPTRSAAREELVRAAKEAGWTSAEKLPDVESPDLQRYGIAREKEDLDFSKAAALKGQKPPTRYSCRIWISDNASMIVAAYRVDGE